MMNRMKAEGHRHAARLIRTEGMEAAREVAHELVLSSFGGIKMDPYTQGFFNEINKGLDKAPRF